LILKTPLSGMRMDQITADDVETTKFHESPHSRNSAIRTLRRKKSRAGHIGLSGLEHAFRDVARKLEIPDALKLYCARHTFGTVAMAETKNPGLVKEVMGHESLSTTMGYLHPETAQIKVVIDRLNQQKYVM
jgi:integrase